MLSSSVRNRRGWCGAARAVGVLAVEARAADDVRPVTNGVGGRRFERFVGPPGPAPVDPEAIRTAGGCWLRLRLV